MDKRSILLFTDDHATEVHIREALPDHDVASVSQIESAANSIQAKIPDLVIVDFDLRAQDGLQVFRHIHQLVPRVRIILLSASNNIPLAVKATKLGAADFIRKPLDIKILRQSVEDNLYRMEELYPLPAGEEWLRGESPGIAKLYSALRQAVLTGNNLIVFAERGIEKRSIVGYIHARGLKPRRKLISLDLNFFRRENLEANFWATIQEVMTEPEMASVQGEEDLCGTLFLDNIEGLDDNFKRSIFDYFKSRKGKTDKQILAVIGISERKELQSENIRDYPWVEVPPLRERKEDLPHLLGYYLNLFCRKHNKQVRAISADLIDFLTAYDYPGNYRELECLLEQGVLSAGSEVLELKDVAVDIEGLMEFTLKRIFSSGKLGLGEAKREFENKLYSFLLAKTDGDLAATARFLDLPKTTLAERLDDLGINYKMRA
jgi:DNA-binding NtrC family response regulator